MEPNFSNNEWLIARVQQLESERNELHKDIEQLCMQQAGPAYLGVATRLHFQRTAGLEQEIENLKKKLATCTRENQNLQEELSEAYLIKNVEAEKQLKFFQGCVAAAFAERDNAILEAEKAKEKVELMPQELNESKRRVEELTNELLEEKGLTRSLRIDLEKHERQNKIFKEVIDKFYQIRQCSLENFTDASWDEKCECLLHDSDEMWRFQNDEDTSTSNYILCFPYIVAFCFRLASKMWSTKESSRTIVLNAKCYMEKLAYLLSNFPFEGLEIETHLKKKVSDLKKKKILSEEKIKKQISALQHHHSQFRIDITNLLDEGYSELKSINDAVVEKIRQLELSRECNLESSVIQDEELHESECKDVHISADSSPASIIKACSLLCCVLTCVCLSMSHYCYSLYILLPTPLQLLGWGSCGTGLVHIIFYVLLGPRIWMRKSNDPGLPTKSAPETGDTSEALALALQEKVGALLLLSQQEERHLLERNVNAALQKKVEELQRNLLQVTNEKVKALMELAQLKQEQYALHEQINQEKTQGKQSGEIGERKNAQEKDGKLKNLLKRTYLTRWVGGSDGSDADYEQPKHHMDFARMKIENATLKESLESMEHLLSSVRRLRISLFKVKDSAEAKSENTSCFETLGRIMAEANLVKTALGSSLPISWSAEIDRSYDIKDGGLDSGYDKVDFVSAAGFEMVELLIFAAQLLKDQISHDDREDKETVTETVSAQ
ncbi:hypothetical protein DH2020_006518 [Rehmannia glutinosa]|uniref:Uncharacterized protein n=1 Tax=Rehmannia glutinosa TaxID=99300 RepID=A0ABR0XJE5_REHGL